MPQLQPDFSSIIPTGSINLDYALGKGGIPGGSIVEILGHDSSGKTSICLSIMAEANKLGHMCAFIDADQTLTNTHLIPYRLDPKLVYLAQTWQAEKALDIIEQLIRSQAFKILILDSIDTLVPEKDFVLPDYSEQSVGFYQLFSHALNKFTPLLNKSKTILIFTQLLAEKPKTIYHNLSQNTSRLAPKLFTSISIQLETINHITEKNLTAGWQVLATLKKNRFGPCPGRTKLDIMYNDGIIKFGEILILGLQLQILQETTDSILFQGQVLGANKEESLDYLRSSPQTCQKIEGEIRQILFSRETNAIKRT